ncbi:NAD(P)H-dependent FMN reductase [Microbacteriaceae bacterium SG_E_30_P1]|uniref:NAD(P)H-dependent FMN reductase n=1 Tax=Antiquaquibacter oligotrophicus TaxID=2880260 RepID=A0ABT6KT35_9MICO|nr:NAD(P)H-dependent oxidoreductase [Antiquaquibacter oligotrophicus]MDH6182232.1 NAD(P)H-dependent FMN reductase [Antiquaquibacter oligotrophicus]UDF12108.1 NAD(P)H-dependent oxidoreductase [Antiquaquibacter oligotrophicus]
MSELKIGIILGSTRPGRRGEQVANWVLEQASKRDDVTYELIDIADFNLPHLDEEVPASQGLYANGHTKAWANTIASYDGFVMVTPEYNHSTSGALKNAIDFIYAEWNNKAVGFVSYGAAASGARAVEHLRLIAGELQLADVRQQVGISLLTDFEAYTTMKAIPHHEAPLATMLDQLEAWSGALREVRVGSAAIAA